MARDAASRGLSVALVEKDDFAGATSRRSTKLLHGGIRYLPHMRLRMIRQGLREQDVLRRTADFLYSDLDFVIPLFGGRRIVDLPRWLTAGPLASVSLRAGCPCTTGCAGGGDPTGIEGWVRRTWRGPSPSCALNHWWKDSPTGMP